MKFILPKPPSINQIYKYTSRGGFARSYISKEGTAWFQESSLIVDKGREGPTINDLIEVKIKLFTARHQDVDNINKPILDLLQKHTLIIKDDAQVFKLTTEKFKCKVKNEHVEVEIFPYSP